MQTIVLHTERRTQLLDASVSIPLDNGRLALGDHQTIFCELDGPRSRKLHVTVT
jgi:thiamine phosphate synthase YjbQ (UPF0047 family)